MDPESHWASPVVRPFERGALDSEPERAQVVGLKISEFWVGRDALINLQSGGSYSLSGRSMGAVGDWEAPLEASAKTFCAGALSSLPLTLF